MSPPDQALGHPYQCVVCDAMADWVCCGCDTMMCEAHRILITVERCAASCDANPHALCPNCDKPAMFQTEAEIVEEKMEMDRIREGLEHHLDPKAPPAPRPAFLTWEDQPELPDLVYHASLYQATYNQVCWATYKSTAGYTVTHGSLFGSQTIFVKSPNQAFRVMEALNKAQEKMDSIRGEGPKADEARKKARLDPKAFDGELLPNRKYNATEG